VAKRQAPKDFARDDLSSQQPIELIFHHPVTLADSFFQSLAVEDLNVTADITNRPGILQAAGSDGYAFAAHA
jgi:hypothetical protein